MNSLMKKRNVLDLTTIIYLTFLMIIFISADINSKKSSKSNFQTIISENPKEMNHKSIDSSNKKSITNIYHKSPTVEIIKSNDNNLIIKDSKERKLSLKSNEIPKQILDLENTTNKDVKLDSFSNTEGKIDTIQSGTLFSLTVTFFISGFGDKSFFVSTIASIKYNKIVCIFASFFALVFMGILSTFLGIEISAFISPWVIDLFSSILFIFMGIKMIIEGIETPEDAHFMKLNEDCNTNTKASEKLFNEEIKKNDEINNNMHEKNKKFLDQKENGDTTISSKETAIETLDEKLLFEISSNSGEEEELIKSKTSKKLEKQFEKDFKEYQKLENALLKSMDTSLTIEEKAELIQRFKEESKKYFNLKGLCLKKILIVKLLL